MNHGWLVFHVHECKPFDKNFIRLSEHWTVETLRIAFSMHRPSLFCALYRATLYILNKRLAWIFTFLRILTKENSCTRFHICSKRRFQKMFNFCPKMSARTMGSLKSIFLGPKIFTRNHNDLESQKNNLFKKITELHNTICMYIQNKIFLTLPENLNIYYLWLN